MGERVSGNPSLLEAYTRRTKDLIGPERSSTAEYSEAVRAFLAAQPNNVNSFSRSGSSYVDRRSGRAIFDHGDALGALAGRFEQLDARPAAFAFALRQVDQSGQTVLSTTSTRTLDALIQARLALPFASDEQVREWAAHLEARTGRDCAQTLDCTIEDFNQMSIAERRSFVDEFQRLWGATFHSQGMWNNVSGVLHFFRDDDLGEPGTWESWVDSSILNGFERGAAMALGWTGGDQGNPGADVWANYFATLRATSGQMPKPEIDRLWAQGEQRSTEHGYGVAASHGTSPGLPQGMFATGGEAYRWLLRHEPEIDRTLAPLSSVNPEVWLAREAIRDFCDPRNPYPSYLGGHIFHGGGQLLEGTGEGAWGGLETAGGVLTGNPALTVGGVTDLTEGIVDTAEGTAEVTRYGGEAVVRGAGWLWDHVH